VNVVLEVLSAKTSSTDRYQPFSHQLAANDSLADFTPI
jgi:hypothetical protein